MKGHIIYGQIWFKCYLCLPVCLPSCLLFSFRSYPCLLLFVPVCLLFIYCLYFFYFSVVLYLFIVTSLFLFLVQCCFLPFFSPFPLHWLTNKWVAQLCKWLLWLHSPHFIHILFWFWKVAALMFLQSVCVVFLDKWVCLILDGFYQIIFVSGTDWD